METCASCRFFTVKVGRIGVCRRYPPQLITHPYPYGTDAQGGVAAEMVSVLSIRPEVEGDELGCGEFSGERRIR